VSTVPHSRVLRGGFKGSRVVKGSEGLLSRKGWERPVECGAETHCICCCYCDVRLPACLHVCLFACLPFSQCHCLFACPVCLSACLSVAAVHAQP
jgi:hypothetical protein